MAEIISELRIVQSGVGVQLYRCIVFVCAYACICSTTSPVLNVYVPLNTNMYTSNFFWIFFCNQIICPSLEMGPVWKPISFWVSEIHTSLDCRHLLYSIFLIKIYLNVWDRGGGWFCRDHCQKFDEKTFDVFQRLFVSHKMRVNLQYVKQEWLRPVSRLMLVYFKPRLIKNS